MGRTCRGRSEDKRVPDWTDHVLSLGPTLDSRRAEELRSDLARLIRRTTSFPLSLLPRHARRAPRFTNHVVNSPFVIQQSFRTAFRASPFAPSTTCRDAPTSGRGVIDRARGKLPSKGARALTRFVTINSRSLALAQMIWVTGTKANNKRLQASKDTTAVPRQQPNYERRTRPNQAMTGR